MAQVTSTAIGPYTSTRLCPCTNKKNGKKRTRMQCDHFYFSAFFFILGTSTTSGPSPGIRLITNKKDTKFNLTVYTFCVILLSFPVSLLDPVTSIRLSTNKKSSRIQCDHFYCLSFFIVSTSTNSGPCKEIRVSTNRKMTKKIQHLICQFLLCFVIF